MNETARALIGRTLGGRFKLTSFIGEGAMASVFRGVQSAEPREVAVKVMHRGLSEDRSFLGRFQREARAAARIDHRNTVRILEHGRDRDVVYIAMELVSGQDLFEVLVRERRLSEARACRIVLQVCSALDAAHRHGVVHRDLKPENVMLVRDPDDPGGDLVKVLDFGIAKLLERDREGDDEPSRADSVITLVGTVIGTPEYMSPEQARGRPPVDARSDVYAAGVLLYQLVTGRLPFRGDSPIDVILQHIERPPLRPCAIVPGLHPGLERIILTALAKWPAERQQSALALADELTAILPELEDSPRQDTAPPSTTGDDEPDEAPPTLRMLPDEPCFTPTEVGPAPVLFVETDAAPPAQAPLPALLLADPPPPPLDVPSPWAMARRGGGSEDLTPAPTPPVDSTVGFWVLLLAVALFFAAAWLARYGP